jgi:dUTP pyrophosphatase
MTTGEKIRTMRKMLKMTQQSVADFVGVDRRTITGFETNRRIPGVYVLAKLADLFNTPIDYLVERTTTRGFRIAEGYENAAILPRRQTKGSAGYDIHAVTHDLDLIIWPGRMLAVETGIIAYMNPDEELQIRPRSGLGYKNQITIQNSPATIDSDFKKPFLVLLRNEGTEPFIVRQGDRIAQAVFSKILFADDDNPVENDRTEGFGHTGV